MQIVTALMNTVQEEQTSTHDIMYHYYDVYINYAETVCASFQIKYSSR